ncbi:MAG: sulfatase-like hydrolase/transferase [Vulcanimicrobiota bacterium]
MTKSAKILGLAGLGAVSGCEDSSSQNFVFTQGQGPDKKPNVLLMIVDELRLPPPGYGPNEGEIPQLKELLGFSKTLSESNGLVQHYPAFNRLRKNAVVMRNHYIAAAACAPSRASFITGAYPEAHSVTQTDGMFKDAEEIRFLDENGIPTLGDWFRAGGYSTHWFGKWHCSHSEFDCGDANHPYLEPWGFSDWEKSCPEAHGGGVNGPAGGLYRDPEFADAAIEFLNGKAQEQSEDGESEPWLAVCSLVNPHDIGYYPNFWYLPGNAGAQPPKVDFHIPAPIPSTGDQSNPYVNDGSVIDLNPLGLPQPLFNTPSSSGEDLSTKPDCHFEYSYKIGFSINSGVPPAGSVVLARPYQKEPNPSAWYQAHGQFYCYLTYLVNLEMARVFDALDQGGLSDNTIVVFISDHGNMAGAHGGMTQKWHTAYDEVIRTPMVVSSPLINPEEQSLREVWQPSSLIDLVPTLLGLTGMSVDELLPNLQGHQPVELVGADLSAHIAGKVRGPINGPDGSPRPGVLFVTDDNITELPDPELAESPPGQQARYNTFETLVQAAGVLGVPLTPGPIVQPNQVRCLVDGEWKLVRYFDPKGNHPDQWEMYHLVTDPTEVTNLLHYKTGELRPGVIVPGIDSGQLEAKRATMMDQLAAQEQRLLHPSPL